jgi:hypothetical protein
LRVLAAMPSSPAGPAGAPIPAAVAAAAATTSTPAPPPPARAAAASPCASVARHASGSAAKKRRAATANATRNPKFATIIPPASGPAIAARIVMDDAIPMIPPSRSDATRDVMSE